MPTHIPTIIFYTSSESIQECNRRLMPLLLAIASAKPHRRVLMSVMRCFLLSRTLVAPGVSRLGGKAKPCLVWCFGMPCQTLCVRPE
jgi:hypothetical protein